MADDSDGFDGISYDGDGDDSDKEDFPMTVTEMMGTKKTRKRMMMLLWTPCKNGRRNPTAQHFDPNTTIVLENTQQTTSIFQRE